MWNNLSNIFTLRPITVKRPGPISNNPIRSQNISTKHWYISPFPQQGTDEPDVYGER